MAADSSVNQSRFRGTFQHRGGLHVKSLNIIQTIRHFWTSIHENKSVLSTKDYMLVSLLIRFLIAGGIGVSNWILTLDFSIFVWMIILAYLLIALFPFIKAWYYPLVFLDHRLLGGLSIAEIVLLLFSSFLFFEDEVIILFALIFPMMTIARVWEIRFEWILITTMFAVIICSIPVILLAGSESRKHWFANLGIYAVFVMFIQSLFWRSSIHNRHDLIRSNIKYAAQELQERFQATICLLRIPVEVDGNTVLFLTGTSPWEEFEKIFYPDMVALEIEGNNFVADAYNSQEIQVANNESELRQRLRQQVLANSFNLKSGMSLPLKEKTGIISWYWDKQIDSFPDPERYVENLGQYLKATNRDYIDDWALRMWDRKIIPTIDWGKMSTITQTLFHNLDFWASTDALVDEIDRFSDAEGSIVLFFDEERQVFERDRNGYGISTACPPSLKYAHFSFQDVTEWMESESTTSDCLSFYIPSEKIPGTKLRHLSFPLRTNEGTQQMPNWKWIGLLVLPFKYPNYVNVLKLRQLEFIAMNASTDLRNCQLHLKSDTALQAHDALTKIIERLFSESQVTREERDFFEIVGNIIVEALDDVQSCTLGSINKASLKIEEPSWYSSITNSPVEMALQNQGRMEEIRLMLNNLGTIHHFDYSNGETSYDKAAQFLGINQSYGVAFDLNSNTHGLIYVNYEQAAPESHYATRKILKLLAKPISQAWQMWHKWFEMIQHEKSRQREFWRYEIHDQLNELQSNVMRPLELLQLHLERKNLNGYAEEAAKIHKGVRGVNATLKQINEDIRDPVYQEKGLFAALYHLKEKVRAGNVIDVNVDADCEPEPKIAGPIYLIAREGVANAFKHGANTVKLKFFFRDNRLLLTIADNGPGYDGSSREGSGTGLMRYQAYLIGATIEWVVSASKGGTTVNVVRDELTIEGKDNYEGSLGVY